MSDEIYKQLRTEWQEKVRNIQLRIRELEHDSYQYFDDLEIALVLMAKLPELFLRLDENQKTFLLQVFAKRITINNVGEIIDYELYSPFEYLSILTSSFSGLSQEGYGSDHVLCRPQIPI